MRAVHQRASGCGDEVSGVVSVPGHMPWTASLGQRAAQLGIQRVTADGPADRHRDAESRGGRLQRPADGGRLACGQGHDDDQPGQNRLEE